MMDEYQEENDPRLLVYKLTGDNINPDFEFLILETFEEVADHLTFEVKDNIKDLTSEGDHLGFKVEMVKMTRAEIDALREYES